MMTVHRMIPALPGSRRTSAEFRQSEHLADRFDGLPQGVTRWRLAAALRAAARSLGVTSSMLRLIEHYIDITYDIDWTSGSEPVITRPLVEIAEHMGCSERQIRNIEAALADRGLLTWRDSANHQRRGRRNHSSGRLIWAYGPSLAPLGTRATEIIETAAAARTALTETRRLRLAIGALRRRIKAQLTPPALSGDRRAQSLLDKLDHEPSRLSANLSNTTLESIRTRLTALAEIASTFPTSTTNRTQDTSPSHEGEKTCRPYTDTPPDNAIKAYRTEARETQKTIPANSKCYEVNLSLVTNAAKNSIIGSLIKDKSWTDLIDAASKAAPMLGIRQDLWADACIKMGRPQAVAAAIVLEAAIARTSVQKLSPVKNPTAYFRELIKRAENHTLNLGPSLRYIIHKSDILATRPHCMGISMKPDSVPR